MKTPLETNKPILIIRIVLQILLLSALAYCIYLLAFAQTQPNQSNTKIWIGTVVCAMASLVFFMQLLFMPIGVTIDNGLRSFEIRYLFLKTKTIALKDIECFNDTVIKTKFSTSTGIVITMVKGQKFLVCEQNFKTYSPMVVFLEANDITNIGKDEFKFISYYLQQEL